MTFSVVLIAVDASLVGGAVLAGYSRGDVGYFFGERQFITYLSAGHLLLTALICGFVFRASHAAPGDRESSASPSIWAFLAVGFLFLAIDEVAMLHENIDLTLHGWLGIEETPITDRLDDVIVLVYALVGLTAILHARHHLVGYQAVLPYVRAGFAAAMIMVILDIVSNRQDVVTHLDTHALLCVLEEAAKIAAGACFLIAAQRSWSITAP